MKCKDLNNQLCQTGKLSRAEDARQSFLCHLASQDAPKSHLISIFLEKQPADQHLQLLAHAKGPGPVRAILHDSISAFALQALLHKLSARNQAIGPLMTVVTKTAAKSV